MRKPLSVVAIVALVVAAGVVAASAGGATHERHVSAKQASAIVTVPEADRFGPFAVTVQAGGTVRWKNDDEDSHYVVSDDAFNTAGHKGENRLLPSGDSFALRFKHPGTFVYYCRLHSHLDAHNQPVAPGPDGGIQGPHGNFGTPMSGVITVLPAGTGG